MKQRLVDAFPFIIAVMLPIAGLALALHNKVEGDGDLVPGLLLASLAGGFIYLAIFSA